MNAAEEVMLDVNALAQGEKFMSVGQVEVSDDNNLLAYTVDNVGFRQYKLHIKDLRTGTVLPDTAERVDSVAWAADNKTLFYVSEDAQTKRSDILHRHELGTSTDTPVFNEKDERFNLNVDRVRDGKYLILSDNSHITSESQFLPADQPKASWQVIEPRRDNVLYNVDEGNGRFYIVVNDTSKANRVVTAPVATPGKAHWTELIAAKDDRPITDINIFRDFYEVTSSVKGLPTLQIVPIQGGSAKFIAFPEAAYTAAAATNKEFDTDLFRYSYESPVTPPSTFDYRVKQGDSKLLKEQKVPNYDKSLYAVERLMLPSRDGALVPTTIVYRKDSFKRSENPLFVYAYGSYGVTIPDSFNVAWIALRDRGVVTAVSHIRRGGELGEAWHDGGKMMAKRNTFTDFIDTTEELLKHGYGKPGQVGIEGASAGGLLMGAVTNMRPDLFKVVLAEVPFVDVMNTMLDATLPLTVSEYEEWGNPNQKAAFDYMRTYSPYDNVVAKKYPAMLVETSFDDSQVMYWEPSKYVAKLRALNTGTDPLVFFINMHGGHGGSSGRYDQIRERDKYYAFLLTQLGIKQ
jgi:oligopeptidase B